MSEKPGVAYNFAVIRAVPHTYLGTFVNVGVVLHVRTAGFLQARVLSDPAALRVLVPGADAEMLARYLEASPVPVLGLMTMPPFTADPEDNRRHFAALKALADEHGLEELSMGTSQDYLVAAAEGATIVRIGTTLYT